MDVGLSFGTMERLSDGKKDIFEEASYVGKQARIRSPKI